MGNYSCTDANGVKINTLYQWDSNVDIVVNGIVPSEGASVCFDFCNRQSETAIAIAATKVDSSYTAPIPNELLVKPDNLILYIVETNDQDTKRTIGEIRIPVVPRPVPSDFVYTPTVEVPDEQDQEDEEEQTPAQTEE